MARNVPWALDAFSKLTWRRLLLYGGGMARDIAAVSCSAVCLAKQ